MKIRTNLPLILKNRGISAVKLSDDTGIQRCYLSWMQQGRMVPTDIELEKICAALGVTADMVYPDPATRKALAE